VQDGCPNSREGAPLPFERMWRRENNQKEGRMKGNKIFIGIPELKRVLENNEKDVEKIRTDGGQVRKNQEEGFELLK